MAIKNKIFVDSSFLVAFFNQKDLQHLYTLPVMKKLENEKLYFFITNLVFLEMVTILSQRGGRKVANRSGQDILGHPNIQLVHFDEVHQQQTWQIFQEVEQKDIGFVDCSIIATMQAENISTLLTFDQHFKKVKMKYRFKLFDYET